MLKLAHNISQNFVVKLYKSFLYKNWSFHVNTHFTDIVKW